MKLKIGLVLAAIASFMAFAPAKGAVFIEVGDRPYYSHGPGYWTGHRHYLWVPGHLGWRYGHRVWIHGHYRY